MNWKWKLLFAFLMATVLGWFLHFDIALSVGSESLSAKGLVLLNLGVLRFLTAFEKKIFKRYAFCSPCVVNVSSLTNLLRRNC